MFRQVRLQKSTPATVGGNKWESPESQKEVKLEIYDNMKRDWEVYDRKNMMWLNLCRSFSSKTSHKCIQFDDT